MLIKCPDCGTEGQEVGKYCENCGRALSEADAQAGQAVPGAAAATGVDPSPDPGPITTPTAPVPDPAAGSQQPAVTSQPPGGNLSVGDPTATPVTKEARFAVIGEKGADPANGFTIRQVGEFLVGRPNTETGLKPDVDVRQWVQPYEVGGQQMYLIHRRQCYLGLLPSGTVTIRAAEGSELDTLVKPVGQTDFVPMQGIGTVRTALPMPPGTYPLETGDQIYMGDPEALKHFQSGDPTARGSYLVLELVEPAL